VKGGAGADYAKKNNLSVTSGQVLTLTVGAGGGTNSAGGDTSVKIGSTTHCLAKGGSSSATNVGTGVKTGGLGGAGDIVIQADETVVKAYGGGGGGAGSTQNGSNGTAGVVTGGVATHGTGGDGGSSAGGRGGNGGSSGLTCGGGGGGYTGVGARGQIILTFTAAPAPDTTPPTITTNAAQSVQENTPLNVSLTADESVTWSIRTEAQDAVSVDDDKFEISGTTLRWTGNGVKDFEIPDDTGANNTYVVVIRATDTSSNTTDKTITVTVTDVAEGGGATARFIAVII
jgi:hypothetical protein